MFNALSGFSALDDIDDFVVVASSDDGDGLGQFLEQLLLEVLGHAASDNDALVRLCKLYQGAHRLFASCLNEATGVNYNVVCKFFVRIDFVTGLDQ